MTGLFIQMSTSSCAVVAESVAHIRRHHPEIIELAFSDVQTWDIPCIEALDLDGLKVWVGAPPVPWYGPRWDTPTDLQPWMTPIAGVAGMLTPSYRWDQIFADEHLAALIRSRGWLPYIGSEVGVDALGDHVRLRQGWEAYLIETSRRLRAAEMLWSPYAWDLWSTVSATRRKNIAKAMSTLVGNVKLYSGTNGVTTIDLQDGRGAQPSEPETDAVNWYNLIKPCGAQVRVNMEWFTSDLQPQPIGEMLRRELFYHLNSVERGCDWERRYWE